MGADTNLQSPQQPLLNPEVNPPEQGSEVDPIRVETIFSRMPLHVLSKSGPRPQINIEKRSADGRVEEKWKVSYNEEYGPAKQLAYDVHTLVIERAIEEAFEDARRTGQQFPRLIPLSSLNEVAKRLGPHTETRNTNQIKKALSQNAGILITALKKYRGSDGVEYVIEGVFTPYGIYFFGQKLPGGQRADQVYINLNDAYFEAWSRAATRPLDYSYKAQLPPIPRRFYELVSYVIYGAIKNGHATARYRYSEFCKNAPQLRYDTFDKVKKQMYKIHKPHVDRQYIAKVKYEETTDDRGIIDWWMIYAPGQRAYNEFAVFTGKKPKYIPAAADGAGESPAAPTPRARQRRFKFNSEPAAHKVEQVPAPPAKIINYQLVAELEKRGISSTDAREILTSLPPDQPVLDQLEWGDYQVAQSRGKITNPAGFYISLLQRNTNPPPTFETSTARNARHRAELERQEALQRETEAQLAVEAAAEAELDLLKAAQPERYQDLYDRAQAQLAAAHPNIADFLRSHPGSSLHEGAIRARIKNLLADQTPAAPVSGFDLQSILATKQLPAPRGRATVSSGQTGNPTADGDSARSRTTALPQVD